MIRAKTESPADVICWMESEASGLWPGKVVTEVSPAGDFWEAEPEHQDYLERYPNGYTCHFIRPGWKVPRRSGGLGVLPSDPAVRSAASQ